MTAIQIQKLEEKSLAEISTKDKFSIVDGPFGTQLHASEYELEGVPVVRVVNTSYSGQFISDNLVYISEKKAEKLKRSKVLPGDIIVAKTGATIGKSGIFPNKFSHGIIASSCIKLTVDQTIADYRFVEYLIQSRSGQEKIIDAAGGSTRTTINTKHFGIIKFLFPAKPEQSKIAEILSTVDRAIERTEALIAKQQRIKTGLMQDLLTRGIDEHGNIRSEQTHKFKDSPLGRIPIEWDYKSLSNSTSKIITYGIVQPGPNIHDGIPFIQTKDLNYERLNLDEMDKTSYEIHQAYERSSIRAGDVVIGIRASVGKVAIVPNDLDHANISRGVARLSPSKEIIGRYLFWILQSENIQTAIRKEIKGSTYPEITLPALRQIIIPIPSLVEQVRSYNLIDAIEARKLQTDMILSKYYFLKVALMQDLLSGKKRLTLSSTDMETPIL